MSSSNKKDGKTVSKADIVMINDNNYNLLGGERESQLIIIKGASQKFKIAVIQPGEYNENPENITFYWRTKSLRIKNLIKNPIAFIIYIFKVGKLIRKISPQIIHSNSQISFFIVSFLKRFRLISKDIILIHTERGLYTKYNNFIKRLFYFSFKYLDILITTTYLNKNEWESANLKRGINIKYEVIENTAGEIYEELDESRVSKNDFLTIGFAGRMCDWKDWPLAEEICSEIEKSIFNAHFKMFVSCLDKSAIEKTNKMFDKMKKCYGNRFEGRINVPFSEMEQFYYDLDIYILTSWPQTESFGRTIVEAMSRKNAILITDAGGAVEVLNNPNNVCTTAKEFADHVKIWDENRNLLNQEKEYNFVQVHARFSLRNNLEKYIQCYISSMGCEYKAN